MCLRMQQSNKRTILSTSQHHAPEHKHTKNQWQGLKLVPCTSRSTTKISGQVLSQHHAPVKLQHRSHAKELASIQQCAPVAKSQQSSRSSRFFQLKSTSSVTNQAEVYPSESLYVKTESVIGVVMDDGFFQLKSVSSVMKSSRCIQVLVFVCKD